MAKHDACKLDGNILGPNSAAKDVRTSYLSEIGKQKILTKKQEIELMKRVKAGDMQAYKQMVSKNLRLVVQIAVKYNSSEFGLMDRISEGNLGLIHAIEKFDINKGFRFSTYAHWWIKQSIERAIMNQGRSVRLPVHVVRLLSKYNKASCKLSNADSANISDIAKELDCDAAQLQKVLSNCENALHLDQKNDDDVDMMDVVSDESSEAGLESLLEHDLKEVIIDVLSRMAPYEHFIIVRHLGLIDNDRNTLIEIAYLTGFTREQVRNREQKAIKKFKQAFKD